MTAAAPRDLGTSVAGVRFPFAVMNAAGAWASTAGELRQLARSRSGGLVLRTATVHPFVHPQYRSLHNPGFDKLVPLVRELAAAAGRPVVASIAGATADEYATLARAFTDAGAALVEADFADPWVAATLAPFEDAAALRDVARRLVAATGVPVVVKLPQHPGLSYPRIAETLAAAGVRAVVVKNEFSGLEKFLLETHAALEAVAADGVQSGYDVRRALAKGARAVQIRSALVAEGPDVFARLEREMRTARAAR
ncbi:MAG TPA: hypothetical protein VFD84_13560 [Candidatus Binatia bacterium]|nr:hypothetical protein [Candidatus Binatia bacterium]